MDQKTVNDKSGDNGQSAVTSGDGLKPMLTKDQRGRTLRHALSLGVYNRHNAGMNSDEELLVKMDGDTHKELNGVYASELAIRSKISDLYESEWTRLKVTKCKDCQKEDIQDHEQYYMCKSCNKRIWKDNRWEYVTFSISSGIVYSSNGGPGSFAAITKLGSIERRSIVL
jgi:hypothetical protein